PAGARDVRTGRARGVLMAGPGLRTRDISASRSLVQRIEGMATLRRACPPRGRSEGFYQGRMRLFSARRSLNPSNPTLRHPPPLPFVRVPRFLLNTRV